MARKGQKFKKYTIDEKKEMLRQYQEGLPASEIEKVYGIPKGTIKTWQYKVDHNIESGKRGRPKDSDEVDYKERYEILKKFQAFLKEQREKR